MKWIERLKAKFKKKTEEEFVEGEMWDFRQNFWGHALNFSETPNEDHSRDVNGHHTPWIKTHDTCLVRVKGGTGVGVYIFTEIRNCNDPKDMFLVKRGMLRYATEEDLAKVGNKTGVARFI